MLQASKFHLELVRIQEMELLVQSCRVYSIRRKSSNKSPKHVILFSYSDSFRSFPSIVHFYKI